MAGADSSTPPIPSPPVVERVFDFARPNDGWSSGYSDYSTATAPVDVVAEVRALPAPFAGSGYYVAGTNRSADLFIYVKTRLSGLVAGTTYRVRSTIEFLTDVPSGCIGVGGAPGESVWIVVAASSREPESTHDGTDHRLNVDRGNQSQSGREGLVLGNIANSVQDCGPRRWESKSVSIPESATLTVRADERGEAWFLVGLDSGYEALSRVYHQRFVVRLEPL